MLDIVFDNAMSSDLILKPYEIKDDRGHVLKDNTYAVVSVDENGIDYECAIHLKAKRAETDIPDFFLS